MILLKTTFNKTIKECYKIISANLSIKISDKNDNNKNDKNNKNNKNKKDYTNIPEKTIKENNIFLNKEFNESILIVLFGWLACEDHHLNKYVDMYKKINSDVIPIKSPRYSLLFPVSLGKKMGQEVTQEIGKEYSKKQHIFLHCFSANGFYNCGHLLRELEIEKKKNNKLAIDISKRIKGVILDSAPPSPSKELLVTGITNSFPHCQFSTRKVIQFGLNLFTSFNPSILQDSFNLSEQTKNGFLPFNFPQLYLYSSDDKIVPPEHIENFYQNQIKAGKFVQYFRWDKVPHVQLYRYFPEKYKQLVGSFIFNFVTNFQNKKNFI
ncbi:hypothetical protein M0811_09521 [Anaeramoeba ignava]|uniref:Transmembrane protein 53 n=1 Tax=Anaeramoeba ignava TaxID=1746090 RepID=A0A9Q0LF59_ANAIG|nr:hypothetical protein M0811_09521 [Anaeramoeba ignava]